MTLRPRRAGMLAAGLLTAAALVALGQPASAAPGAAHPAGRAAGPAAVDRSATRAPTSANATAEARHRVPNPLLKEILSEEDEGESQDDPALSALCQDFITKPNPYRNPAPNVDQIRGDSIVTIGSQAGCSSAQNETTIAVNPANPRNIVAGANDYRVFVAAGAAQRQHRLGVHELRRRQDLEEPGAARADDRDRRDRGAHRDGRGRRPGAGLRPAQHRLLRQHRLQPGRSGRGRHRGAERHRRQRLPRRRPALGEPTIIQLDGTDAQGNSTPTTFFNDKIWMAADKTSGRVYVTLDQVRRHPRGGLPRVPDRGHRLHRLRPHVLALHPRRHHAGRLHRRPHPVLPGLQPAGRPRRDALHRVRGHGVRDAGLRRHGRPGRHRGGALDRPRPHVQPRDRGHQLRLPGQRGGRHRGPDRGELPDQQLPAARVRPDHRPAGAELERRPQRRATPPPASRSGPTATTSWPPPAAAGAGRSGSSARRRTRCSARSRRSPGWSPSARTPGTTTRAGSAWTTRTGRASGSPSLRSSAIRRITTQTSDPRIQFAAPSLDEPGRDPAGCVHRRLHVRSRSAPTCGCTRAGPTSAVGPERPSRTRTRTPKASRSSADDGQPRGVTGGICCPFARRWLPSAAPGRHHAAESSTRRGSRVVHALPSPEAVRW